MRDYLDNHPLKLRGVGRSLTIPQRPFLLTFILCVLAGGLLLLDQGGFLAPVRGLAEQALGPMAQRLTGMRDGITGIWSDIDNVQELREENKALKRKVGKLEADLIALGEVLVENAHLRQQLAIENRHPWRLHGAEVIVRSPDAGQRVMTIASGSKDGVQVGMAVIAQTESEPAALAGIVDEVGPHTARVLLITDAGSKISARVLYADTTALGIVQGQWQNGSLLRLEQIDREIPLEPGLAVVSAGLTKEMNLPLPMVSVPGGVPIGVVQEIVSDGSHSQSALLRPHVAVEQVHYVWVVLSHEK